MKKPSLFMRIVSFTLVLTVSSSNTTTYPFIGSENNIQAVSAHSLTAARVSMNTLSTRKEISQAMGLPVPVEGVSTVSSALLRDITTFVNPHASKRRSELRINEKSKAPISPLLPFSSTPLYIFSDDIKIEDINRVGAKAAHLADFSRQFQRDPIIFRVPKWLSLPFEAVERIITQPALLKHFSAELLDAVNYLGILTAEENAELAEKNFDQMTPEQFGDAENPLLVSVRAANLRAFPGRYLTILNVGITDKNIGRLSTKLNDPAAAWELYAKLIRDLALSSDGGDISRQRFDNIRELERLYPHQQHSSKRHFREMSRLEKAEWFVGAYKKRFEELLGRPFPQDPFVQLEWAIQAIAPANRHGLEGPMRFNSIMIERMVFGNLPNSLSANIFSRNPQTGKNGWDGAVGFEMQGDDLLDAEGFDEFLERINSQLSLKLQMLAQDAETYFRDIASIEFTIERGELYLLQVRNASKSPEAMINAYVDMVNSGILPKHEAIERLRDLNLEPLKEEPISEESFPREAPLAAIGRSVGVLRNEVGIVAFTDEDAKRLHDKGKPVIFMRPVIAADHEEIIRLVNGVVASRQFGNHAQSIALRYGIPAIVDLDRFEGGERVENLRDPDRVQFNLEHGEALLIRDGNTYRLVSGETAVILDQSGGIRVIPSTFIQSILMKLHQRRRYLSPPLVEVLTWLIEAEGKVPVIIADHYGIGKNFWKVEESDRLDFGDFQRTKKVVRRQDGKEVPMLIGVRDVISADKKQAIPERVPIQRQIPLELIDRVVEGFIHETSVETFTYELWTRHDKLGQYIAELEGLDKLDLLTGEFEYKGLDEAKFYFFKRVIEKSYPSSESHSSKDRYPMLVKAVVHGVDRHKSGGFIFRDLALRYFTDPGQMVRFLADVINYTHQNGYTGDVRGHNYQLTRLFTMVVKSNQDLGLQVLKMLGEESAQTLLDEIKRFYIDRNKYRELERAYYATPTELANLLETALAQGLVTESYELEYGPKDEHELHTQNLVANLRDLQQQINQESNDSVHQTRAELRSQTAQNPPQSILSHMAMVTGETKNHEPVHLEVDSRFMTAGLSQADLEGLLAAVVNHDVNQTKDEDYSLSKTMHVGGVSLGRVTIQFAPNFVEPTEPVPYLDQSATDPYQKPRHRIDVQNGQIVTQPIAKAPWWLPAEAMHTFSFMRELFNKGQLTVLPVGFGIIGDDKGFLILAQTSFPHRSFGSQFKGQLRQSIQKVQAGNQAGPRFKVRQLSRLQRAMSQLGEDVRQLGIEVSTLHNSGRVYTYPKLSDFDIDRDGHIQITSVVPGRRADSMSEDEFLFWSIRDFTFLFISIVNLFVHQIPVEKINDFHGFLQLNGEATFEAFIRGYFLTDNLLISDDMAHLLKVISIQNMLKLKQLFDVSSLKGRQVSDLIAALQEQFPDLLEAFKQRQNLRPLDIQDHAQLETIAEQVINRLVAPQHIPWGVRLDFASRPKQIVTQVKDPGAVSGSRDIDAFELNNGFLDGVLSDFGNYQIAHADIRPARDMPRHLISPDLALTYSGAFKEALQRLKSVEFVEDLLLQLENGQKKINWLDPAHLFDASLEWEEKGEFVNLVIYLHQPVEPVNRSLQAVARHVLMRFLANEEEPEIPESVDIGLRHHGGAGDIESRVSLRDEQGRVGDHHYYDQQFIGGNPKTLLIPPVELQDGTAKSIDYIGVNAPQQPLTMTDIDHLVPELTQVLRALPRLRFPAEDGGQRFAYRTDSFVVDLNRAKSILNVVIHFFAEDEYTLLHSPRNDKTEFQKSFDVAFEEFQRIKNSLLANRQMDDQQKQAVQGIRKAAKRYIEDPRAAYTLGVLAMIFTEQEDAELQREGALTFLEYLPMFQVHLSSQWAQWAAGKIAILVRLNGNGKQFEKLADLLSSLLTVPKTPTSEYAITQILLTMAAQDQSENAFASVPQIRTAVERSFAYLNKKVDSYLRDVQLYEREMVLADEILLLQYFNRQIPAVSDHAERIVSRLTALTNSAIRRRSSKRGDWDRARWASEQAYQLWKQIIVPGEMKDREKAVLAYRMVRTMNDLVLYSLPSPENYKRSQKVSVSIDDLESSNRLAEAAHDLLELIAQYQPVSISAIWDQTAVDARALRAALYLRRADSLHLILKRILKRASAHRQQKGYWESASGDLLSDIEHVLTAVVSREYNLQPEDLELISEWSEWLDQAFRHHPRQRVIRRGIPNRLLNETQLAAKAYSLRRHIHPAPVMRSALSRAREAYKKIKTIDTTATDDKYQERVQRSLRYLFLYNTFLFQLYLQDAQAVNDARIVFQNAMEVAAEIQWRGLDQKGLVLFERDVQELIHPSSVLLKRLEASSAQQKNLNGVQVLVQKLDDLMNDVRVEITRRQYAIPDPSLKVEANADVPEGGRVNDHILVQSEGASIVLLFHPDGGERALKLHLRAWRDSKRKNKLTVSFVIQPDHIQKAILKEDDEQAPFEDATISIKVGRGIILKDEETQRTLILRNQENTEEGFTVELTAAAPSFFTISTQELHVNNFRSELRTSLAPEAESQIEAFRQETSRMLRMESVNLFRSELKTALIPEAGYQESAPGLVIARSLAFDEGALGLFAKTGIPTAVIAPTLAEQRLIEVLNEQLDQTDQMLVATGLREAAALLRAKGVLQTILVTAEQHDHDLWRQFFYEVVVVSQAALQEMKAVFWQGMNRQGLIYERLVQAA